MDDFDVFRQVEKNIDKLAEANVGWSIPVSHEEIEKARSGHLEINISGSKVIPREWFPDDITGVKILCLAGAGGQQAPLCAAAGADVTVLDLSENMLGRDRIVAEQEKLPMKIVHGNMCDLSRFADESFDIVINPPSLMYVPNVMPVFNECYRVLKKGGALMICAPNPTNYLCEYVEEGGYYIACNKLPYISYEHDNQGDWIDYGHTLEDYLGGLIQSDFTITGFYEDDYNQESDASAFLETCFVVKASKR
jgi:2-polyprenyl-3-methyl-5-hydroxy-6-metoxy-1,4-benzoquinol methylase